MYTDGTIKVKIELIKSETVLKTMRNIISSWFIYLGALLGSTFGILESFGLLMSFFESLVNKIEQKRRVKVNSEKVVKSRFRLRKFIWSESQVKSFDRTIFGIEETDFQKIY